MSKLPNIDKLNIRDCCNQQPEIIDLHDNDTTIFALKCNKCGLIIGDNNNNITKNVITWNQYIFYRDLEKKHNKKILDLVFNLK